MAVSYKNFSFSQKQKRMTQALLLLSFIDIDSQTGRPDWFSKYIKKNNMNSFKDKKVSESE